MILLETHRPGRVELCGGSLESQLLVSAHLGTIKYSALITYETLNNASDPLAGNNVLCWLMTSKKIFDVKPDYKGRVLQLNCELNTVVLLPFKYNHLHQCHNQGLYVANTRVMFPCTD